MNIKLAMILLLALTLRLPFLHTNPPGFYSDEASFAYNAYSILKTGKDEYGRLLPWYFEAFGDYKLPVTTYTISLSFALFGVNNFTARLPTALYGVLSVYALFLLTIQVIKLSQDENKQEMFRHIPYLSALLLAITPSHTLLSRGVWDIQPALAFVILMSWTYLKAIEKMRLNQSKSTLRYFLSSAVFAVLSMYSYNSPRVVTPLIIIFFTLVFAKTFFAYLTTKEKLLSKVASILTPVALGMILLFPQIISISQPVITQRAKYVSVFHHGLVPALLNETYTKRQGKPVWQTRLIHNKYTYYGRIIASNYISQFTPQFLFLTGDTHEIFKTTQTGFLLIASAPFLFIGIIYAVTKRVPGWWLLLGWLFITPIPSALTIFVPSMSRALNMVIPLTVFTAYGIQISHQYLKNCLASFSFLHPLSSNSYYLSFIFYLIFSINLYYFLYNYFIQTPISTAHIWESGFQEMVKYVYSEKNNYDRVIVSSAQAPSYIWFAWYGRLDPQTVWSTRQTDFTPDSNGLNTTSTLDGIDFSKNIKEDCQKSQAQSKTLCVGFAKEFEGEKIIQASNGVPKFVIDL